MEASGAEPDKSIEDASSTPMTNATVTRFITMGVSQLGDHARSHTRMPLAPETTVVAPAMH